MLSISDILTIARTESLVETVLQFKAVILPLRVRLCLTWYNWSMLSILDTRAHARTESLIETALQFTAVILPLRLTLCLTWYNLSVRYQSLFKA